MRAPLIQMLLIQEMRTQRLRASFMAAVWWQGMVHAYCYAFHGGAANASFSPPILSRTQIWQALSLLGVESWLSLMAFSSHHLGKPSPQPLSRYLDRPSCREKT